MTKLSLAGRLAIAAVLATAALAAGTQVATASTVPVQPTAAAGEAGVLGVSAPEVFAGFSDNVPFTSVLVSKKLLIPTGTYTAMAKLVVTTSGANAVVNCRLTTTTGGDADESRLSLTASAPSQTMTLQFNTIINATQDVIALSCQRITGTGLTITWIKIAAIRVDDPNHLHNTALF
jgi:hypothetical protein